MSNRSHASGPSNGISEAVDNTLPTTWYNRKKISSLPNLNRNEQHPDLVHVQVYLRTFGYLGSDMRYVEGKLDETTAIALAAFQRKSQLGVTGNLDSKTVQVLSQPRCGMPDSLGLLNAQYAGPWTDKNGITPNLTYSYGKYSVQTTATPAIAQACTKRAFNTWETAGAGLTFNEVAPDKNPKILIEWRPSDDPDHSLKRTTFGNPVAHADFPPPYSMYGPPPLPLHFDDQEEKWVDNPVYTAGEFDIESVALHEIGHLLGLYHVENPDSIMHPQYGTKSPMRGLSPADTATIRSLYQPPSWQSAGGRFVGEPAVVSWQAPRVDIFMRGLDNSVLHASWDRTLSVAPQWEPSVGGAVIDSPCAVASSADRIDLFGRSFDNSIVHTWCEKNVWHGAWESVGGATVDRPFAISSNPNRLDLFIRGTDNAVWHKFMIGNKWSPSQTDWNSIGGQTVGRPIVASWDLDRMDLFVRGTNNGLFHKYFNMDAPIKISNDHTVRNVWLPRDKWDNLEGIIISDPAVVARQPGILDIIVQGQDNKIWHKGYNNGWWPSMKDYQLLGGQTISKPTLVAWGPNRYDMFITQPNHSVGQKSWEKVQNAGPGVGLFSPAALDWKSLDISTSAGAILGSVVANPAEINRLFARGESGDLQFC